jgi:hypothetical protein
METEENQKQEQGQLYQKIVAKLSLKVLLNSSVEAIFKVVKVG